MLGLLLAVLLCGPGLATSGTAGNDRSEVSLSTAHEQIAFVGDQVAMHFIPSLEKFSLHRIVNNHPSLATKCPSLAVKPLHTGSIPLKLSVVSPFKAQTVLLHDPETGVYILWQCHEFDFGSPSTTAPCSIVRKSQSKALKGVTNVANFEKITLTLDSTGTIRLYSNTRELDSSEDSFFADIFSELPTATSIHLPELKSSTIFAIARHFIFEHNPTTGNYRVWFFDVAKNTLLGPTASGNLPGYTLSWMGDDRILASTAQGDYLMLRLDTTQLVSVSDSEISLSTIGRGKIGTASCQHSSCVECTADPACGWCSTSEVCLPGNSREPCYQGEAQRCPSWLFGFCAVSSCGSRLTQDSCVTVDQNCGWCEPSSTCLRRSSTSCSTELTTSLPEPQPQPE